MCFLHLESGYTVHEEYWIKNVKKLKKKKKIILQLNENIILWIFIKYILHFFNVHDIYNMMNK